MSINKSIRQNLDGKYIIIHADEFDEGIEYAADVQISQIQLRNAIGTENTNAIVDFKKLAMLSDCLKIISFSGIIENIVNFELIYSLQNIEKIYFENKQSFTVDVSKFQNLIHLGSEYWKGLTNIHTSRSLKSLVLYKFPGINLNRFSGLSKLTNSATHI